MPISPEQIIDELTREAAGSDITIWMRAFHEVALRVVVLDEFLHEANISPDQVMQKMFYDADNARKDQFSQMAQFLMTEMLRHARTPEAWGSKLQ